VRNGFSHYQDIVVLVYRERELPEFSINTDILIRPMLPTDLPVVESIDHNAFESIWQLSLTDLRSAYDRGSYSTIAECNGEIIGYLMSSLNGYFAHLSRLAVIPGFQGKSIGYTMVYHLLQHYLNNTDVWEITVNTQNTNTQSLALYKRAGFRFTGETFPVLMYER
jgi:ribosomal protein S18 acetylase RimI-like enzyme